MTTPLPKMKHPTQDRMLKAVERDALLLIQSYVSHWCSVLPKGINLEPYIAGRYEVLSHLYKLGVIERDARSFIPHRIPHFYFLKVSHTHGIKPELAHWAEDMGLQNLFGKYLLLLEEHGDPLPWIPR